MRIDNTAQVKVNKLVLKQYLEAKQMGCTVMARLYAVDCEGIKAGGWA